MDHDLSVILDAEKGATLVDTGLPGQAEMILEKLAAEGISRGDLKRIFITHQDVDHIGSLKALKEATGATTLALDVEIPYIDGTRPGYKTPPPERLEQNPEFKAMLDALERCPIDVALKDGEVLDLAGRSHGDPDPWTHPGAHQPVPEQIAHVDRGRRIDVVGRHAKRSDGNRDA